MKVRVIWALIGLNAVLAAALVWRYSEKAAYAQPANRRTGDVVMIPGRLNTGNTSIVYLIDPSNHQLSAMSYTAQGIEFMAPPVDLDRVFAGAATVGGNGANRRTTPTR